MCGIVAFLSNDSPISETALQAAIKQLHHRGPEARNGWISPDRKTALGHTRLSIIDLTYGAQPISNEDNRVHIVVNGEFYGFESIQRNLTALGHHLKTQSDSEIALHLYEEYGVHCLHHLRGEFAFVIWDERNRTLFAARDRFGIKPLYYTIHNGTLYMASEIKALIAAGVAAIWDEDSFYHLSHFITHLGNSENTLFKGIYQVPAGHYMLARDGQVRFYQYWDIDTPTAENIQSGDEQTHVEQLREKLQEAVRLRMRADVPVGCYLSGGLDSCAVLGMAAQYTDQRIQAFTLSFDHQDYDERLIAEEMAGFVGADFHPIPIQQSDLATHFADAVFQSETLFCNANGIAKYLLSRAVRDAGFKVVLTGEGSDEIFAGYPHFRRDMLLYQTEGQDAETIQAKLDELQRSNQVSSGFLMAHGTVEGLDSLKRILGFAPSFLEASASSGVRLRALLSDAFLNRYEGQDPYQALLNRLDIRNQLFQRDPLNQSLYLCSKLVLPNYILNVLGDRMEMAHSIEGRVPFLDHQVVELARSMPTTLKIKGMTEKYILREAAKPFITETVYRRQKHPFMSPPGAFSADQSLNTLIQDTLRGSRFAKLPFFDQIS